MKSLLLCYFNPDYMLTLFELPAITINTIRNEFILGDKMLLPVKGHKRVNETLLNNVKVTTQNEYSADKLIKKEFSSEFEKAFRDTIKFNLIQSSLPADKQDKDKKDRLSTLLLSRVLVKMTKFKE